MTNARAFAPYRCVNVNKKSNSNLSSEQLMIKLLPLANYVNVTEFLKKSGKIFKFMKKYKTFLFRTFLGPPLRDRVLTGDCRMTLFI